MTGPIASVTNPKVKGLVRLRDSKERAHSGLFLIEGARELSRAVEADWDFEAAYVCEALLREEEAVLVSDLRSRQTPLVQLAEVPFRKVAYRDHPGGLLVVARARVTPIEDLNLPEPALLLLVESVEKPGNLGTMIRSADAAGAHAVIAVGRSFDFFNPNAIRSSVGAVFCLPLVSAPLGPLKAWLTERGISLVASSPSSRSHHTDADLTRPVAIAVGSEHEGLSGELIGVADQLVSIPMAGASDSLNTSAAAAVLLFEAARQRGFSQ